jgi:hypothetical protein
VQLLWKINMTKSGKTFKDQKEVKALKHEREPRPHEKGGHTNLIKEALEEISDEQLDLIFPREDQGEFMKEEEEVCTCNAEHTCEAHRA